ncbi:hypothetical protein ACFYZJ_24610 [Streptomyces sp. NPDC001848]|uniref:hypothetical protein n=1 Tax=Streptomyces sp. NPDC001848 TaxID=3364618 RepID=UPI00368A6BE8
MIASLALVMAAGAAAPAMAAGQTATHGQRARLSGGCDGGHRDVMDGLSSGGGEKDCKIKVHEVSRTVQVPPQGNTTVLTNVDVTCPAGEQAISGGSDASQAFDIGTLVFRQVTTTTPGDTWRVGYHNFSTTTTETATAFAYCAS